MWPDPAAFTALTPSILALVQLPSWGCFSTVFLLQLACSPPQLPFLPASLSSLRPGHRKAIRRTKHHPAQSNHFTVENITPSRLTKATPGSVVGRMPRLEATSLM